VLRAVDVCLRLAHESGHHECGPSNVMIIPLVDLAYGKTRVIEPRLPFLYESKFMATIISSFDKRGIGAHAYRLLCPFHKRRASSAWASLSWVSWRNFLERLYSQSKSMVRCRPNVKFGLHVHRAREANVDALGKEKRLGKKIVGNQRRAPQVIEIGTPFQNCVQL